MISWVKHGCHLVYKTYIYIFVAKNLKLPGFFDRLKKT